MTGDEYHTLTIAIRWVEARYEVELTYDDPGSQAGTGPRRGNASFGHDMLERLLSLQSAPAEYGQVLANGLFCDPAIAESFIDAESRANQSNTALRVRLRVDRSARELRTLRWELLRHPRSDVLLSTSETIVFSRLPCGGEGQIKPRARSELTALIAISAPTSESLEEMKLAPVDYDGELRRVREVLGRVRTRTLGGPVSPLTLDRLLDEFRHGVDIVYLVCHGQVGRQGTPTLVLQDDAGRAMRVEVRGPKGQEPRKPDLATCITELREKPRLMVLASCQSAGNGEFIYPMVDVTKGADPENAVKHPTTAQTSMASLLVESGVPAIIAMQGFVSMRTIELMMPKFFSELLIDGRIDRALAIARGKVRTHHDWWMPVLYSRLKPGPLWSMPGFGNDANKSREIIDFSEERSRHEYFFGREDVLREMDDWVDKHESGWLLLTGGPGLGKSALMDRWVRGREETGLPTAFHFIRRAHKNWADPSKLRASLAAQVEEDFPEQRDNDADPGYRLEQLLRRVSPVLAERNERLVLMIDALDEAMEPGERDPIPQIFPLEAPSRVLFVVTSRPRFPNLGWFERRTGWSYRLDLDHRSKSNKQAVQEYWGARGPGVGLDEELMKAAIERAEGNLLHATQLHKRWSEPGVEPSTDDIPQGFQGMLDELWQRTGTLPKQTKTLVRTGLSLLCAARESLPLHVVEEMLDWDEGDAEDEFLPHAREMLLEERWHSSPRYRPFHEGFRELLERKLRREMTRRREMLAEYAAYGATGDSFRHGYALRHRVEHLVEVGDADAAASACFDVDFLTAKVRAEGMVAIDRDIRLARGAQQNERKRAHLLMLSRLLETSVHWAVKVPEALPALLHNRAHTYAPELLEYLSDPSHPSGALRLRHALHPRGMARILEGAPDAVSTVMVSPDGHIVSGSFDGTVRVWDIRTGRVIITFEGHQSGVNAVALSPDGHVISGSDDNTVRVWDLQTGRAVATLKGHQDGVTAIAVSPDGHIVSGSRDKTVRLWNIRTGRTIAKLKGHGDVVTALAISPDGRIISGSSDSTVRVWNVQTGRTTTTLEKRLNWVFAVAVLPDGRIVSGSRDGAVRVWNVHTERVVATLEGHEAPVVALAVSVDGRVISGSWDRTVRVWDVPTRRAITTLEGHQGWVLGVSAAPDGRVVSGSADKTIRVWDINTMPAITTEGHQDSVYALAVLPDGRVISGSSDTTVRMWDARTGQVINTLEVHQGSVNALAVLPDGRFVSGSSDTAVRVWDARTGRTILLKGRLDGINALTVLPDGRVVSGSAGGTVRIWDVQTGQVITTLEGSHGLNGSVTTLAVLSEDRVVSGSRNGTVMVWDVRAGRTTTTFGGDHGSMNAMAVLPDERVILGSNDCALWVWDIQAGQAVSTLEGHQGSVHALMVLPDGRVVSGSDDKTVRVWDIETERCLATAYGNATFHSVAAISNHLIVAGDALGDLWFIDLP